MTTVFFASPLKTIKNFCVLAVIGRGEAYEFITCPIKGYLE
jgi:hypothetical protein